MAHRALAPVIGTTLLIAIVLVLSVVVAMAALAYSPVEPTPTATVSATVSSGTVELVHEGGESLDVRTLTIWIEVDDQPLQHQPPIPFFAATGYAPGPDGPFNSASDPMWTAGQSASFTIASTNEPTIGPGSSVTIRISSPTGTITVIETTAR